MFISYLTETSKAILFVQKSTAGGLLRFAFSLNAYV